MPRINGNGRKYRQITRRQVVQGGAALAVMAALPVVPSLIPWIDERGCQLLIRTVNGENWERYMAGDVVNVLPGDRVRGRMESLDQWLSEGRSREDWPGGFQIVHLPTVRPEIAYRYLIEGDKARRLWRVDLAALHAMATSPRDQHKIVIDREARLVHAAFSMKPGVEAKPIPVKPVITWGVVDPIQSVTA